MSPKIEFGIFSPHAGMSFKALVDRANLAEQLGYHSIEEAYNSPKPVQQPHPPITIGGSGEKVMLRIVAKYADRWNCPAGYRNFEQKFGALKEHCKAIGRDINTINVSEQLLVCLGHSEAEVEEKWKAAQRLKPFVFTGIKGTPQQLVEQLH